MIGKSIPVAYIRERFRPKDRVAIVVIDRRGGSPAQRIKTAEQAVSPEFQRWLRFENSQRRDIYVGMNPLKSEARGRHRADIAEVRHVFLDFDDGGTEKVRSMLDRNEMPIPHAILNTSQGKYQTIWRVEQFSPDQAELLMRRMTRELGADIAATDSSRVLRLPGFNNWKRETPFMVTVQSRDGHPFTPADFPAFPEREVHALGRTVSRSVTHGVSQSERDWAWTLDQLERGAAPNRIEAELEARRQDKPNPRYYARHTVEEALKRGISRSAGMER